MDALLDSLIQLLIDWGYVGLFISSFLAGSIVPFSSEVVMAATLGVGLDPTTIVVVVTLGNTAGGMTCYYMGHLGRMDWIEKYFGVKREKLEKTQRFLQGKGALMGFFAFLPFVGEAIAIALGFMRSNLWLTTISMFIGKLLRYIAMLWAVQETMNVVM
ncbi:MAG: DedA family protein [Bacteroides sp.]|nr:DedA family protein [Bacteroides sp.]